MKGRRLPRHAPGIAGMLFMLSVIAGLLFMHGVQSSTSPTDIRGVPLMSATTMQMSTEHAGHAVGHSCQCDGHQHPGGQMCLALLTLGALLLFSALLIRPGLGHTTPPSPATSEPEHSGRPPPTPSIFQLSVLRL